MTPDLSTQLLRYGEYLDELAPPVQEEEFLASAEQIVLEPAPRRPGLRLRRGWAVAVAAALATVLLIGGVAWLVRSLGGEGAPVITELPAPPTTLPVPTTTLQTPSTTVGAGPTTTRVPATTTTSPEPVVVAATGWTLQPVDTEVFDPRMGVQDVTAGGPGLVAVGRTSIRDDSGSPGDAAVWTSEDGITWSRVPHDPQVFGDLQLLDVTSGGPGLVATGRNFIRDDPDPRSQSVVLLSADGITWTRIEDPTMRIAQVNGVTSGGIGLAAVGFDLNWRVSKRAIWTSEDGTTWTVAEIDPEALRTLPGEVTDLRAITRFGSLLVAVGNTIFTSDDGVVWESRQFPRPRFSILGLTLDDVAAGPGGIIATDRSSIWFSTDAITWTEASLPRPQGDITSLASFSQGFVAVGSVDDVAAVWSSPDGLTWSRVPHDPDIFVEDASMAWVTEGGPGLVVFGERRFEEGGSTRFETALWTWSPNE